MIMSVSVIIPIIAKIWATVKISETTANTHKYSLRIKPQNGPKNGWKLFS